MNPLKQRLKREELNRAEQLAHVTDWTAEELLEYLSKDWIFNIDDHEVYQVLTENELEQFGHTDKYASNIHQHSHYWVVTLK